jgi:Lectin C-type domain
MRARGVVLVVASSWACAGAGAGGEGSSSGVAPVIVPAQPPQPTAASSSPTPGRAIAPPSPAFKCETGKRFDGDRRTYCGYTDADTWEASERRCVANGGHLLTLDTPVTSDAAHAALGSPLGAGRAVWIGLELKNHGTRGAQWTWVTGQALAAASWSAGEPNDFGGNEACAEFLVADGKWNDTRCNLAQSYLCQNKGQRPACSGGRVFEVRGAAYCLHAEEATYANAKRACAADFGTLAVLSEATDNDLLRLSLASHFSAPKMWIGLNDVAEKGTWTWTSGAPVDLEAWYPGEPNDFQGNEDCGELYADTWTWNDLDCSVRLPSVCESPPKPR